MSIPVDYRWVWLDESTSTSLTMLVNPSSMTSPLPGYETESLVGADGATRTRATPAMTEWGFTGVVRSLEQENTLRSWLMDNGVLLLTDHLGRQFRVLVTKAPFVARASRPRYKATYNVSALILEGPL